MQSSRRCFVVLLHIQMAYRLSSHVASSCKSLTSSSSSIASIRSISCMYLLNHFVLAGRLEPTIGYLGRPQRSTCRLWMWCYVKPGQHEIHIQAKAMPHEIHIQAKAMPHEIRIQSNTHQEVQFIAYQLGILFYGFNWSQLITSFDPILCLNLSQLFGMLRIIAYYELARKSISGLITFRSQEHYLTIVFSPTSYQPCLNISLSRALGSEL